MFKRQTALLWGFRLYGMFAGVFVAYWMDRLVQRQLGRSWEAVGTIASGCCVLVFGVWSWRKHPINKVSRFPVPDYFKASGIALIAMGVINAIPGFYPAARDRLPRTPLAISMACFLLLLGWSAHIYKRKSQYWYGFTEATFAMLFIVDRCRDIASVNTVTTNWGTLIGAVYFLARGLNNLREGEAKRRQSD